jgi:hypothetical protein
LENAPVKGHVLESRRGDGEINIEMRRGHVAWANRHIGKFRIRSRKSNVRREPRRFEKHKSRLKSWRDYVGIDSQAGENGIFANPEIEPCRGRQFAVDEGKGYPRIVGDVVAWVE